MDPIYIVIITILMALAVSDLIVGVSNDAVNFLNSALGSKAAPRWVIMTVASVGILVGAIFSSGMMEVARNGIFNPAAFDFHSIMMIFLAVMLTDVILLDTFNTLGLPTSTTVSLVFELLGASVAVALVLMGDAEGGAAAKLSHYINSSKAISIIGGILSSVVVAFTTGIVVMFISRLIFSFRYKTTFKYIGAVWCGVALTAISYFTVFKGLKETTLMSADLKAMLNELSTFTILCGSFLFWTVLMAFCQWLLRLNVLKITVLAGTLSLALAFAGNDLVNFIGVFMAGKSSYDLAQAAADSGVDVETLKMSGLAGKVQVEWLYLFAAGAVMTVTLWFSKKAQKVSDTEINLARQDSGAEQFGSTLTSRALVRSAVNINKRFCQIAPKGVQNWIEKRFAPFEYEDSDKAPFDLIRATVNLSAASILIAMATSLKLPLSTTYVTFMVAMGSSLADRAWGRESAVYRITGVLAVVSGWFLTAFVAFVVAFLVAIVLHFGGEVAIYGMTALCAFLLLKGHILPKGKKRTKSQLDVEVSDAELPISDRLTSDVYNAMQEVSSIYKEALDGLLHENRKTLKKALKDSEILAVEAHERKHKILSTLRTLQFEEVNTGHYFVQVVDYLNEVAKALSHITKPAFTHIDNNHKGLSEEQIADLTEISSAVEEFYSVINKMIKDKDFSNIDQTMVRRDEILDQLEMSIKGHINRIMHTESSTKAALLHLSIISETKTMLLQSRNVLKSQRSFITKSNQQ